MKLPKIWTTVTPLSRKIALVLFILLPFLGFYIGWNLKVSSFISTPNNTIKFQPSPTPLLDHIDEHINYIVPDGWKKKYEYLTTTGEFVTLSSPDYRYNSNEGPDNGMSISILRQKYTSNLPLQKQLEIDKSNYQGGAMISPYTIGGIQGYSSNPDNDLAFDKSYPTISVLKDGYVYHFVFRVFHGSQYHTEVNEFLKSVKFI